jgi:hypothetical protein
MIASLIGLVVLAPDLRVAYTARYYYPAGDPRKSVSQVYLCDLEGKNRRAITTSATDCTAVRWTGPNSLAWVVERGEKSELWATTLGGKASRLRSGSVIYALVPAAGESPGAAYNIDGKAFGISGSKLKALPPAKPQPKKMEYAGPGGAKLVIDCTKAVYDWSLTLTRSDGTQVVEKHEDDNYTFQRAYPQQADGSVWIVAFVGNSTTGGSFIVNRFDWTSGKLDRVASGTDLDFRLGRDLWASVSTRDLAPLGKGEVWTSQATIGSQKTGKQTALGSGMVYFTSISLR